MALKIDKVQLQFDIKPNYEAQQLNKLKDDLSEANKKLAELKDEKKSLHKPKKNDTQAWAVVICLKISIFASSTTPGTLIAIGCAQL